MKMKEAYCASKAPSVIRNHQNHLVQLTIDAIWECTFQERDLTPGSLPIIMNACYVIRCAESVYLISTAINITQKLRSFILQRSLNLGQNQKLKYRKCHSFIVDPLLLLPRFLHVVHGISPKFLMARYVFIFDFPFDLQWIQGLTS